MRFLNLLLFISLTCFELARAQNFAPIGARWTIVPEHENFSLSTEFPYFMLEAVRDTIIEGRVGSVVLPVDGNLILSAIPFLFFEEAGQVTFYEDDAFKLLYDFNLDAGDTMVFYLPWNAYQEYGDTINKVVIDSVDLVNIDGVNLKRMHSSYVFDEIRPDKCVDLGVITERLGSHDAMFGQGCYVHAGKVAPYLRCYEDSLINEAPSYMPCDFLDGKRFAPYTAVWHYESFSPDCTTRSFLRVEAELGPVNADYRPRSIRVYDGNAVQPKAEILLRHDFDQIFFQEDNQFKLLYDFGLEAGDTMTFHVPRIRHHFDFTCNDSLPLAPSYQVVVDSVSFQTIHGLKLKSLHTSPLGIDCIDLGIVTEKFGSSNGLFGVFCNVCTVGCSGHFRCYSDEDIDFMASTETCDYTTSTNALDRHPEITIYPVPSSEFVQISGLTIHEIQSLTVIDIFGRTFQLPIDQQVNISFLTTGYYILAIETSKGERIVRPIIKS